MFRLPLDGFFSFLIKEDTARCRFALQGSPTFQLLDDCEYVFVWRTVEACPVVRVEGEAWACSRAAVRSGGGLMSQRLRRGACAQLRCLSGDGSFLPLSVFPALRCALHRWRFQAHAD